MTARTGTPKPAVSGSATTAGGASRGVVAARGWAVDDREFEPYVNCIAVPIRSPLGVVGAVSITAIRVVADLDRLKTFLPALRETSERISRELG